MPQEISVIVRTTKFIQEILGSAIAGAAILAALLVWWVAGKPISLAFLSPYLQEALSAEDGSFRVELDDTVLTWAGWERTLDIRLVGVRTIGPEGVTLASVPEVSVSLSVLGMFRGLVAPTSIEVMRPKIHVLLSPELDFELALGEVGEDAGNIVSRAITDLLAPPNRDRAMGYLKRVSILDSVLTIDDQRLGILWRANAVDIVLTRNESGIKGEISLDLEAGEYGHFAGDDIDWRQEQGEEEPQPVHFDAEFSYTAAEQRVDLGVAFSQIEPQRFASRAPFLAPLENVKFPVSGTVALSMNLDGRFPFLGFDLSGDAGKIGLPGFYDEDLEVEQVTVRGRFEDDLSRLFLDEVFVDLGATSVNVTALLSRSGEDLVLQGEAVVHDVFFDDLDHYWPKSVGVPSREWVTKHLSVGVVAEARATFSVEVPEGDFTKARVKTFSGTFDFAGVRADYLSPMPALEEIKGTATFSLERMDIDVEEGEIGGIRLKEGTVNLMALNTDTEHARIEAVFRGSARDLLAVLDHEPLGAAGFLGMDAGDISGETAGRAVFEFPLARTLVVDQVKIAAAANLSGVSLPGLVAGRGLSDGELRIRVDKKGMELAGKALFEGVPAEITGYESFTDESPFVSRYAMQAVFTDETRARLGLDTSSYLTGPVEVDLIWTDFDGTRGDLAIAANLEDAFLELSLAGWSKPVGAPGTARVSLSLSGERPTEMREFSIKAGDLDVSGRAEFTPDGKGFRRVDFQRLVTGRNDFSASVTFRPGGGYDIDLRGASLDLIRFFKMEDEEQPEFPPINITVDIERLWVKKDASFNKVSGVLQHEGEVWRSIFLDAEMKEGSRVSLRILPVGERRRLTLKSNDAGEFLRRLDFYRNAEGGELELSGTIDGTAEGNPFTGRLEVVNYRILNAPILARMLTLASLTGIVHEISGKGIEFERFSAPIQYMDDRVKVTDGGAFGSEIGITFKGELDLEKETVQLEGTLVPAYTINSIWGKIPVFGKLLTGEKGSGVFAATFDMSGPIGDPEISINPLAALTPGFLRKLFGIFELPKPEPSDKQDTALPRSKAARSALPGGRSTRMP